MQIEFTREQMIANALLLHASSLEDVGLLHGKMGVAIYFHHLARQSGNEAFAQFADELIDQVIGSLNEGLPVEFERGITGIGWAVEHLIRGGFVDADADEVLLELDARIIETLTSQESDIKTVVSIGYYLAVRLGYRVQDEQNLTVLSLKRHTILLVNELERFIAAGEMLYELPHLLGKLHTLNVFNHKIEQLQKLLPSVRVTYLIPFVPRLTDTDLDAYLSNNGSKSRYSNDDSRKLLETERWGLLRGIAGIGLQTLCRQPHALQIH